MSLRWRALYQVNGVFNFGQLKYLKSLRLEGYTFEDMQRILNELIAGNVQLERLELDYAHNNNAELLNTICQMKSIKSLAMKSINDSSLMLLTQNLVHLTEIYISGGVTFRGIRHALEQSTQLTIASITSISFDDTVNRNNLNAIDELRKNRSIYLRVRMMYEDDLSEVSMMNRFQLRLE